MENEAILSEYFDQKPEMASRDKTRTREAVKIFIEHGITEPLQSDYDDILKPQLQARNVSDTTIRGYAGCARKFYKWQKEHKKGDRPMNEFSFGVTEEAAGIERQKENEAETITAEGISDMAIAVKHADMSNSESLAKPKRGRPKKADADRSKRKQISVYLEPEIYEGIQALSFITNLEITKIAELSISETVKKNAKQIAKAKDAREMLNEIKTKLQGLDLNF